ncbi:MAG: hypothetical protein HY363_04870 [Candidatus Aenigmarchaeota archaeon]|nr:hypothetical protein [Candidatus Aenigmarchaeota archaeon]
MKSYLALFLIFAVGALADCRELPLTYVINESITLCSDTYEAPDGITITANNVVLDCGTAVIKGNRAGRGIITENKQGIRIQNCNIVTFATGIYFRNVSRAQITQNNLVKSDIGIMLEDSYENLIVDNGDKSLQMPLVLIRGRFNTISFENKNVEGALCDGNACNSQDALNPCVSFDGYCSSVCSEQSDEDCKPKTPEISAQIMHEAKKYHEDTEKKYNTAAEQVRKMEEEIRKQVPASENKPVQLKKARIAPMFLMAAVIIGIAVIVVMNNKTEN